MKANLSPAPRRGFTITELLVSMALIVFIMYIIAEAFAAGSAAFRNLKAIGDMNERLRSALGTVRRYLQADHFEGKKRLSDPDFWKDGPPQEGFVRIWHGDNNNFEGQDLDTNNCYRTTSHGVHFTARLRGFKRGDLFATQVPGTSPLLALPDPGSRYQDPLPVPPPAYVGFAAPWAEVAVFLQPTGEFTKDTGGNDGLPMFSLLLRQRLLVSDNDEIGGVPAAQASDYQDLSTSKSMNGNLYFNNPGDVTMPVRRFGSNGADLAGATNPASYPLLGTDAGGRNLAGADTLIGNVLSFDVRLLTADANDFHSLHDAALGPAVYAMNNAGFGTARVFDTWSQRRDDNNTGGATPASYDYSAWATAGTATSIPIYANAAGNRIRIRALQITLRVWDDRTKQTRQSSIVVDM